MVKRSTAVRPVQPIRPASALDPIATHAAMVSSKSDGAAHETRNSRPFFESLESRDLCAWNFLYGTLTGIGTDGVDADVLFSLQSGDVYVVRLLENDAAKLGMFHFQNVSNINLQSGGGDDIFLLNGLAMPIAAELGEGNDRFLVTDGAEGASTCLVVGGEGNDTVVTGKGDDLIVGDAADFAALSNTWFSGSPRSQRIAESLKLAASNTDLDDLTSTKGFDVIVGQTVAYSFQRTNLGQTVHVSTTAELSAALPLLQYGDRLELEPGIYDPQTVLAGRHDGVTIVGLGNSPSDVVLKNFRINVSSQGDPFLLQNLTLDLTDVAPLSYPSAINHFEGSIVLDQLEVFGQAASNTAALYFTELSVSRTDAIIMNSYLHNTAGDIVSTGGWVDAQRNADSLLELYGNRGHGAGPLFHHQVITAHFGFRVVDIGGEYWDAQANVIAPDNMTGIDLFFTHVSAGARQAGVQVTIPTSVFFGCTFLDQTFLTVYGVMDGCVVISQPSLTSGRLIGTGANNVAIRNCHIVSMNPGGGAVGLRIVHNDVSVVDNVFEDWGALAIEDLGIGTWIDGNEFL